MKKTLKNIITTGTMAGMLFMPFMAIAQDDDDSDDSDMRGPKLTFCEMVQDKTVDDFRNFGHMDDMQEKRAEREGVFAALRAKMNTKRDDKQQERQEKFEALTEKWEANAKNWDETQAIAEMKIELREAMMERQNGILNAVDESRADKDAARADAQAAVDAAMATLQEQITEALDKAKTDCENGVSSATVRVNFSADVKIALDAFKSERKDIRVEIKDEVKATNDERKEEMVENRTTFKSWFQSFRERLQALFKARTELPDDEDEDTDDTE